MHLINHCIEKKGGRQTNKKDNVEVAAFVQIQGGVLLVIGVIAWVITVVMKKISSRSLTAEEL